MRAFRRYGLMALRPQSGWNLEDAAVDHLAEAYADERKGGQSQQCEFHA